MVIGSADQTIAAMRWKAWHFLKPKGYQTSTRKETYGFKTCHPAPQIEELKAFENDLREVVKSVKTTNTTNELQETLKKDTKEIKSDNMVLVAGDKTSNFYKLEAKKYEELLDKNITSEYKKTDREVVKTVDTEDKELAAKLDIDDRVHRTREKEAFITIKDHKENFRNNTKCRLINPTKPELGKVSKRILEAKNKEIKEKMKLTQFKNTAAVLKWFQGLKQKHKLNFIQFDIVNYYPSVKEELLTKAIEWAQTIVKFTEQEKLVILQTKKSLLFSRGQTWTKQGETQFDVTMGSFDGAECTDLVGLYILSKLKQIPGLDLGLFRDDGLGVSRLSPRSNQHRVVEEITRIFSENNLKITIEVNKKVVDFLDVTLDLELGVYRPYTKPNHNPLYVHKQSNHPPSILENIPKGINKRLSSISANEDIFNQAAPVYQESLKKSGYNFKLKFDPEAGQANPQKSKNRKRKITWFNPPYSISATTKIGAQFLALVDRSFPREHALSKIFNRNTLKVSYRTTPNMQQTIVGHNSKVLKPEPVEGDNLCNCTPRASCPMGNKCLLDNVIYHATVTETDTQNLKTEEGYVGLASTTFKKRFYRHNSNFEKEKERNDTTLSAHIWKIKERGSSYSLKWKILDRGQVFNPATKTCQLCTKEKFFIIFKPELATLNSRNELGAHCRHKKLTLVGSVKAVKSSRARGTK